VLEPLAVDDELPEFDWLIVVLLEFVAVAAPLVTEAVDVPVFEPVDVLEAVPPVLPLAAWPPLPPLFELPPDAPAFADWLLWLLPLTFDDALLPPVLADADCVVVTWACCDTSVMAFACASETLLPLPPVTLPLASAMEPPLFVWLPLTVAVLPAVAAPDVAVAEPVPVFVPLFVFVAEPPVLPAADDPAVPSLPPPLLSSPPLAEPSAHCWLSLLPFTFDDAWLSPVLAFDCWSVETDAL